MNTSRSTEEGEVNQDEDGQSSTQEEGRISVGFYTVVGYDHFLVILAR
jgi:hypothetical protein